MKKILHLISSPRGAASFSIKLGNAIVEKILAAYPGSTVKTHDLTTSPFPHLEEVHLNSFFTPAEQHTEAQKIAISHSNEAIKEIFEADILVIGAPMYNFGIPSTLKTWLDHIARSQVTFKVTENGPVGLITGKKVYIAMSSGGVYAEGPAAGYDFVVPYLKSVFAFLGITDVEVQRAEGTSVPGLSERALEKAVEAVQV